MTRPKQPRSSQGSLRAFTAAGEELWKHVGIEVGNSYGGYHSLAVDRRRDRIYARGNVSSTVHAFTLGGRKVWRLDNLRAGALVVDEKTGDLWCRSHTDETVVFDQNGNEKTVVSLRSHRHGLQPQKRQFLGLPVRRSSFSAGRARFSSARQLPESATEWP